MFIGVIHDNSDMDRIKRLASALLETDISTAGFTGTTPIEQFMNLESITPRYPMYLTCFYALPTEQVDSMVLLIGTEFFGNMKGEFTRAMAKREITTRANKINQQKDGSLATYFAQFKEPDDHYWNFLAFLSLTHDPTANIAIDTIELAGEVCPFVHYSQSLIGSSYILGFESSMREREAKKIAKDPAFSNVAVLAPKK